MNKPIPLNPVLLAIVFSAGCAPTAPPAAPAAAPAADARVADAALFGRAGPASMDLDAVRDAIASARILHHWRKGKAPDTAALDDIGLRRQLIIQGLENLLVREEFARRALTVEPGEMNAALENAAHGRPAGAPAPDGDPETLDARLAARYGAPAARVREAVLDVMRAAKLASALVDETPDEVVEAAWRAENTELVLDVLQVPRVPSTREIDQFVSARGAEIDLEYDAKRGRFHTPERAVVHRILSASEGTAARLRDEILADADRGAAFARVARAHSEGPNAGRGGRLGPVTQKRLPAAFSVVAGELTPVQKEREGWAFYWVERRLPAQVRALDDPRVRREIAATLLREKGELAHARSVADEVRARLAQAPTGERLTRLVAAERVRRHQTPPFNLAKARSVPGIGLAPKLFEAAARLTPDQPITPVVPVRQHYVVARLVRRTDPVVTWDAARAEYRKAWSARVEPRRVDQWLSERLKGEPMWVDVERLRAIPTASLLAPAPNPAGE